LASIFSSLLDFIGVRADTTNSHPANQILTPQKFKQLEKIIGASINDKSFYIQALMHRSFLEELEDEDKSNERMEFLGDSVLSCCSRIFIQ
jgi:ribonuclease-3